MFIKISKSTFVFVIVFVTSSCASLNKEELACNFSAGASSSEFDKDDSSSDNFANIVLSGFLNMLYKGVARNVSPNNYDSCVKKDMATCIDSTGNIKKECMLTK